MAIFAQRLPTGTARHGQGFCILLSQPLFTILKQLSSHLPFRIYRRAHEKRGHGAAGDAASEAVFESTLRPQPIDTNWKKIVIGDLCWPERCS